MKVAGNLGCEKEKHVRERLISCLQSWAMVMLIACRDISFEEACRLENLVVID